MRHAQVLWLGSAVASGLLACNWTDFDSALDKAPVVSFDTGGSSASSLVAVPLLPPAPGGKVSARMLVARKDTAYLALAELDKDGKVSLRQPNAADVDKLAGAPVANAAVLDPSTPDSPIILGTPSFGQGTALTAPGAVSLLTTTTLADGTASLALRFGVQGQEHFGISVAAGKVTDLAGPAQFVALSDYVVQLLGADASTAGPFTNCQNGVLAPPTALYGNRPMVVADLLPGGGEEIVLSGLGLTGLGRVVFVEGHPATGTSPPMLDCSPLVLAQDSSPNFGASLAAGDFDGDRNADLAVGAPPDRVYVYFGPFGLASTQIQTVTVKSSGSSSFGNRIAAYTVQGQTRAQLLVADSSASVGSRAGAGQVMLLNVPMRGAGLVEAATVAVTTVFDSSKDSPTGVFGDSLGSLWFDTRTCNPGGGVTSLPWATSAASVLTFFAYPTNAASPPLVSAADPRCFVK